MQTTQSRTDCKTARRSYTQLICQDLRRLQENITKKFSNWKDGNWTTQITTAKPCTIDVQH